MIPEFKDLSQEEAALMFKVPLLVSILIAGADNDIDRAEIKEAVTLSRVKQNKAREALLDYYKEAGKDFEEQLMDMIKEMPADASKRNPLIIDKLVGINAILPKLDKTFAIKFYGSIKDIAKKIAEASGGLLGYMAVGYEESKLIGLDMINDPSDRKAQ